MTGTFSELGSLAKFVNGAAFTPDDWSDDGKRIIRIQNLTDTAKPFNRTTREVPERLHVHPGDLLVSWSASLGVFEWAQPDVALLNQHIFRVIPDERKVDKRYLRHGLEHALQVMQQHLHGATMQHVNRGEFLSTRLFTPPLLEQLRIGEILDKADTLRAKRRVALAQLGTLTQSIFLDMFGDPVRNPHGWPTVGIEDACELIVDCVNRTAPVVENPTPFKMVRTTNVKSGRVLLNDVRYVSEDVFARWNRRATPRRGDVILTREAPVGEAGIIDADDRIFLGQRLMLYRTNRSVMTAEYLLASFMSPFLQRQFDIHGSGSTVKHLSLPVCRSFRVHAPPIELQRKYTRLITAAQKLLTSAKTAENCADALFASLQHRAFRGEL